MASKHNFLEIFTTCWIAYWPPTQGTIFMAVWTVGLSSQKVLIERSHFKVKRCFQCHVQVVKLGLNCKWSSFCWLGVYYCRLTHQAVSTLHVTCQLPHVWWSLPNVPHRCTVKPPGQSTVFNGAYRSIFCRAIKKLTFHGCHFFYLQPFPKKSLPIWKIETM